MDHPAIVVPRSSDRLEPLRIVPSDEDKLAGRLQRNATDPVCPEGESVMQAGEAEQFAGTLARMSQVVVEGEFDSLGVDTEDNRRAHWQRAGLANGPRLGCVAKEPFVGSGIMLAQDQRVKAACHACLHARVRLRSHDA